MDRAALRQACTLPNLCRLFALLLVAWQPFAGEYRVPLVGSALLGLVLSFRGEIQTIAEPAKRLGLLLLCLVIPGMLSIPTSLAPSKSWAEIASVALVALAGLSVLYGLKHRTDHQWLQTGLIVVIAAWTGDGLLQAFTGADVFGIAPPRRLHHWSLPTKCNFWDHPLGPPSFDFLGATQTSKTRSVCTNDRHAPDYYTDGTKK